MPGKFDYFGASHQIFHVFVVLAVLSHYKVRYYHPFNVRLDLMAFQAVLTGFEYWHGQHHGVCNL